MTNLKELRDWVDKVKLATSPEVDTDEVEIAVSSINTPQIQATVGNESYIFRIIAE